MSAIRRITPELVSAMASEHGTPLLVTFEEVIERNLHALSSLMPRVRIFYAMKANPDIPVVETVLRLGGGLDVASVGELGICRELSVDPARILYTQPIKREEEIEQARGYGIDLLVCDNAGEIEKVARSFPGCRVLLRVRVTNPYCVVDLSEKFGCEPGELVPLADRVLSYGLRLAGICFHVGSQTISPSPYVETLKMVRSLAHELALKRIDLDIIDIGGGFPLSYLDPIISIDSFCAPIVNVLTHMFGGHEIYAEPGRFVVGSACILLTRVIGKSLRDGIVWYYIDDGLYGTLSGKVYDKADYPIRTFREGPARRCVIAGPTCDSFDIAFKDRVLPELEIGDVICVESVGAYTSASATAFNGMPGAKRIFVPKEG